MRCNEIKIRSATTKDHDAIWEIFHEIISAGDTYSLDPRMSREEALAYWFRADTQTYVAELHRQSVGEAVGFPGTATPSPTGGMKDQVIVGTYILRPNQSGGGSHVANAAFMVASDAQGCGVGRAMAEHCLNEARRIGFRAMQFNYVISTNTPAIRLWQELGFEIVGTLPGAFRHPEKGYVDVYVMFRSLLP
ncbi:MAG: GNAT family N-acetyltransferase [Verrucomicrobia bacterium]|nr:MAG: GNAT family N-acetyltransferase [Verrucomicrobiota bacterium]